MVDEVFSIPCKEFDVKVDERKEVQTLRIKSFYQIPQLSPRQFAIRALVPEKVFPHEIPGLSLNLQEHWKILINAQYIWRMTSNANIVEIFPYRLDLNLRNHWRISSSEKSVFSRQKSRSEGFM